MSIHKAFDKSFYGITTSHFYQFGMIGLQKPLINQEPTLAIKVPSIAIARCVNTSPPAQTYTTKGFPACLLFTVSGCREIMQDLIKLDLVDLTFAVALMASAIGLSAWEKLGLELNLAIATGRTILQLLVLGYVFDFIFAINNAWAVLGILAILLTIGAIVARNRISQKIPLVLPIVWGAILVSTALTLFYTYLLILQPDRWFEARYLIPLAGIIIGNAMNAAAIAGERLVSTMNNSSGEIETHLSLGATPQQAVTQYRREAIRAAILPTLNQMMLIGMATLPSITAGQLLGGVNPLDAVSYEILILFMVAVANLLTTILVTRGLCRQFFNSAAQLIR